MITLVIPPKKAITEFTNMLKVEMGKAEQIKDRVNRNSVIDALKSSNESKLLIVLFDVLGLKQYNNKTPKNGLILFCGHVLQEDGKTTKKLCYNFEPFKTINTTIYKCDNKFYVDELADLLEHD